MKKKTAYALRQEENFGAVVSFVFEVMKACGISEKAFMREMRIDNKRVERFKKGDHSTLKNFSI